MARVKRFLVCMAGMVILAAMYSETAVSAGIKSLVNPGEVIEGHKKYEEQCEKCHKPFSKESQNMLCRNCHEELDADIRLKQGIHGLGIARDAECSHCHSDHKGRTADIILLDVETFSHEETDYPLRGMHRTTDCTACHASGEKYRDAPQNCFACHEDDDIHERRLGKQCADCHDERSWRDKDFDHDSTDFVLRDKHAELACNSCHVNHKYKDIPGDCHACHALNDVHAGRYGQACGDCHSEAGWDRSRFDHDHDTEYPLTGKHRDVKCDVCHPGKLHAQLPDTECVTCHRGDDKHGGRYGKECQTCHSTRGWGRTKFEHDIKTEFPLRGKHQDASCSSCHKGEVYEEKLATECHSCHIQDDVHAGQEGKQCGKCHEESGWAGRVRFEHDMTGFPLLGLHAVTPCEECHLTSAYKIAASDCHDCHQPDDVHERRMGPDCAMCHNPNDWSLWEFDHNSQTDYKLDGAHADIDCLSCHTRETSGEIKLSTSCVSCHRASDVHDGQFGKYCDRCHITKSFDVVEIR
jgi:Zn finger protein HypA/HybF involved in hydrogenase expression